MDGEPAGNGNGPHKWPPVRIPPEQYAQLRQLATENQRSLAGEVRYAISLYLRSSERRKAAASA